MSTAVAFGIGAMSVFAVALQPEQVPRSRVVVSCVGCARLVVAMKYPFVVRVPGDKSPNFPPGPLLYLTPVFSHIYLRYVKYFGRIIIEITSYTREKNAVIERDRRVVNY